MRSLGQGKIRALALGFTITCGAVHAQEIFLKKKPDGTVVFSNAPVGTGYEGTGAGKTMPEPTLPSSDAAQKTTPQRADPPAAGAGDAEVQDAIADFKKPWDRLRRAAADDLGSMGPRAQAALPLLIEAAQGDSELQFPSLLAAMRVAPDDPEVRQLVAKTLENYRVGQRDILHAVESMARSDDRILDALAKRAFDSENEIIRQNALITLGQVGQPAVGRVLETFERESYPHRSDLARWFEKGYGQGDPEQRKLIVQALIKALDTMDYPTVAIEVLGTIGPPAAPAVPSLVRLLDGAVAALQPPRLPPRIISPNKETCRLVLYALGKIGPAASEAVPTIITASKIEYIEDQWVRTNLQAIGSPEAKAFLEQNPPRPKR
jgi:HEAT repeat protein